MFKLATLVAAALVVAPVAFAQDTTDIPACILNCTTNSLEAGGCTGIDDLACICSSAEFQTAAGTCIATDCPDQAEAALTLQTEQCAALTGSESVSGSDGGASSTASTPAGSTSRTVATGSATSRPTSASASTSRSASTSATSSTPNAGFHTAGIASGVTLALFGAAFSLF